MKKQKLEDDTEKKELKAYLDIVLEDEFVMEVESLGDLKTLFEPDEENELWKNQHEYNLISWRLCDSSGIHILYMDNGIAIHMLIEKKFPLGQEMISKMLNKRFEVKQECEMEFELLRNRYA
nr:hypothetical protein [Tanacetum cinerariifolium]